MFVHEDVMVVTTINAFFSHQLSCPRGLKVKTAQQLWSRVKD